MKDPLEGLPDEIKARFWGFFGEVDGEFQVKDKEGMFKFLYTEGVNHPSLLNFLTVNKEKVIEHVQKTGEGVPGIKVIKTTELSDKVSKLEIFQK